MEEVGNDGKLACWERCCVRLEVFRTGSARRFSLRGGWRLPSPPPHYSRIYSYPTRLPSKRSRISIATRMIRADRSKRFGRYNCSRYVRTYVRTRGGRHFNGIPSPSHVPLPFRKSFRATAKNNRAIYLNSGIKVAAPGFGEGRRRGGGGERNDESS